MLTASWSSATVSVAVVIVTRRDVLDIPGCPSRALPAEVGASVKLGRAFSIPFLPGATFSRGDQRARGSADACRAPRVIGYRVRHSVAGYPLTILVGARG